MAAIQLDRYDREILRHLQNDSQVTNQELAEKIGLSPSPCLRRVKRLQDEGMIIGCRALLDPKKLGLGLVSFIQISMDKHTPERFEVFEREIGQLPQVLECHLITGQAADYLLKVIVEDMDDFQEILLQNITRIPGVTGVHSSFVMKSPVMKSALPI